jgi:Flp pilus assembly protein TadD/predicted Ser/Thr protein kinase
MNDRPTSPPDPFIGRLFKERFRVIETLGHGGMGTVYLAEQISIGRKVALKILHGGFARDEEFVRRFRDEARAAASVRHRNVVVVHDYDQTEDGHLFIAMEYLEGRHLGEVIRRGGPLHVNRVLQLGIQAAEGLYAAHRAGVIHRDVKPQNIMLVGEEDEVKLLDFGIARLREPGRAGLTSAGMMMGTPEYMAPEQIEGGEPSERTDVYALGIVLYEMLTGVAPFAGPTVSAVFSQQLQQRPSPVTGIRSNIPPALEGVIMKALEKQPDSRQRDMGEVIEGLRLAAAPGDDYGQTRVGSQDTIVAGRDRVGRVSGGRQGPPGRVTPDTTENSGPRGGKRWALVAASVGVSALVGIGAWVILSGRSNMTEPPSAIESPPGNQPTAAVRPTEADEAARQAAAAAVAEAERREAEAAVQAAETRRQREEEAARRGDDEAARRRAEEAAERQRLQEQLRKRAEQSTARAPTPQQPSASIPAPARRDEARDLVQRGIRLASDRHYDQAVAEFTRAIKADPTYGVAYANRGVAYMQQRDYVKALVDLRKAAEVSPQDKMVHYNLAALYALRGEKAFALDSLENALRSGFDDSEAIRRDQDFDLIRTEPRFRQLVERYLRP